MTGHAAKGENADGRVSADITDDGDSVGSQDMYGERFGET